MLRPAHVLLAVTLAVPTLAEAAARPFTPPSRVPSSTALQRASAEAGLPPAAGPKPTAVLVALRDASATRMVPADARVEAILLRHGLDRGRPVARDARFLVLRSGRPDFDAEAAADELRATGRFRAVVANRTVQFHATIPDDPYLAGGYEWFVHSDVDVDIDLPEAWDVEQGSAAVVIGVMDTGVDTGHPDLAAKIWTNPGEIPANGFDDDGNGRIDDVHGWDFGDDDANPNPEETLDPSGIDVGFHGTFVAGLAAAANDNGEGIAGAGWNCRIMPLKVVSAGDSTTLEYITAAFEYAAEEGCDVLNTSFGVSGPGVPAYMQALVDMATAADVVCVASAGNAGDNSLVYPAANAHVIAVAATDDTGARASFSNWGSHVDVAAPGATMFSCIARNYPLDPFTEIIYLYFFGWDGENPYMFGDGTSFSAPLVAGVCGLIRAHDPALTPDQVAARLVLTGDAIAYDHPIGPRVNAYAAVAQNLDAGDGPRVSSLTLARPSPNPFRGATVFALTLAEAGRARLVVVDAAGRVVCTLVDADLTAGTRRIGWDGTDAAGRAVVNGIYFARLESGGHTLTQKVARIR